MTKWQGEDRKWREERELDRISEKKKVELTSRTKRLDNLFFLSLGLRLSPWLGLLDLKPTNFVERKSPKNEMKDTCMLSPKSYNTLVKT